MGMLFSVWFQSRGATHLIQNTSQEELSYSTATAVSSSMEHRSRDIRRNFGQQEEFLHRKVVRHWREVVKSSSLEVFKCGIQLIWKGSIKGWTRSWRSFPTCYNPGILNLTAHLGNKQDHTNPARKRRPGGRQRTPSLSLTRHTQQSSSKTPQNRAGLQSIKTQQ